MNLNIKKISFWLAIVMTISFVLAGIFFVADMAITKANLTDINEERAYDAKNLKNLSINTNSIEINVLPNEKDEVRIHLYGKQSKSIPKTEFEETVNEKDLSITVTERFVLNVGLNLPYHRNLKLDVFIPKKKFDSLDISCSSGNITSLVNGAAKNIFEAHSGNISLTGLSGNIDANCNSGNISLENIKGESVELKNSSGDIILKNMTAVDINIRSSSGKIEGKTLTSKDTTISSTSGSTIINGFSGNLDAGLNSGDIYVDFDKFDNTSVVTKASSGNTTLLLPANSNFKIKSKISSGNFTTDFQLSFDGFAKKKDFSAECGSGSNNQINVRSSSGDIKVLKK